MSEKSNQDSQFKSDVIQLINHCLEQVKQNEQLVALAPKIEESIKKFDHMEVKRESGFVNPDPLIMVTDDEKIELVVGRDQDCDYRKHLLVEILASSMNNKSEALKKGLSSLIINNTMRFDFEDLALIDEEEAINLLSQCYGQEEILNYIIEDKMELDPDRQNALAKIVTLIDHNYEYRKKAKKSYFVEVQKEIINNFVNKENLTNEELQNFRLNLWADPEMFQELDCDYQNLAEVEQYFNQVTAQLETDNLVKAK